MSVLIKGMEMPKSGSKILLITASGDVWDGGIKHLDEVEAVPIPPHGRLIDADKLWIKLDNGSNSSIGQAHSYYKFAKVWLDQAETIIPAEEGEG